MTDFCKQCIADVFGEGELNDLNGLITKAQSDEGLFARVLCGGCGITIVDHEGKCVSKNCNKQHGDF